MPAKFCLLRPYLALCASLFVLPSCGSHSFDVVRTAQSELQAGADASTLSFAAFSPVVLLDDQVMQLQRIARRQLAEVKLHAMTLSVMQPGSSQDLTFLQSVSVSIAAAGLPTKILATGQNFAPGQSVGVLAVSTEDFVDYFSTVDPTISLTGEGQPPIDITLEVEIAFALQVSSNTILFQ